MTIDHSHAPPAYQANSFLNSLNVADAAMIMPLLTPVSYRTGDRLRMHDAPEATIYFPLTLVASCGFGEHDSGLGLIGREGLIGWPSLLGLGETVQEAQVLFDGGTALVVPARQMRIACFTSPTLSMGLLRFVQAYTVQLACMMQATGRATLKQRLSAWLLMIHDRIDGNLINITHQVLGLQLQVRRASVTDMLHLLEGDFAVRCDRRAIVVRDRHRLEQCAGAAYGHTEAAYRDSIGPFGKVGSDLTTEAVPARAVPEHSQGIFC